MTSKLQFYVSDLAAEVSLMERLASKFLEKESAGILASVRSQIEILKSSKQQITIGVDEGRPIRTIACKERLPVKEVTSETRAASARTCMGKSCSNGNYSR